MMQNMANIKKAKLLSTNLNLLDRQELDYIEKQANSLLAVQDASNAAGQEKQAERGAFAPEYEENKG